MASCPNNSLAKPVSNALALGQRYLSSSEIAPEIQVVPSVYAHWMTQGCPNILHLAFSHAEIWAATTMGVVLWRFENNRPCYVRFGSEHGLPGNQITHILLEATGKIWATGPGIGLWYCDDHLLWQPYTGLDAEITAFVTYEMGEGWAFTSQGLAHLRIDRGRSSEWSLIPFETESIPEIRSFSRDAHGNLYLGTVGGLLIFDAKNHLQAHYTLTKGFAHNEINAVLACETYGLLIGTHSGAYVLKQGGFELLKEVKGSVRQMIKSSVSNSIWITTSGGIYKLSPDGIRKEGLPEWINLNNQVSSISASPEGVWGSLANHLLQFEPQRAIIALPDQILKAPTGSIEAVGIDLENRVWAGGPKGLWVMQQNQWQPLRIAHSCIKVRQLVCSSTGYLWTGSWESSSEGGLHCFKGRVHVPFQKRNAPNSVEALYAGTSGRLWVAAEGQVKVYDGQAWGLATNLPEECSFVHTLFVDANNIIWMGCAEGLYVHKKKGWDHLLSDIEVYGFGVADNHVAWAATSDGLFAVNGFQPHRIQVVPGKIQAICLAPDQSLWLGTQQGLIRYVGGEIKQWTCSNSGLGHNNIKSLAIGTDKQLWIGTANGISRFLYGLDEG